MFLPTIISVLVLIGADKVSGKARKYTNRFHIKF